MAAPRLPRSIAALGTGVATFALAAPTLAEFEWIAPDSCPSGEVVRGAARRTMGGASTEVRARAVVERSGGGWTLLLTTPSGVRRIEADTCQEIVDAALLVLSLATSPNDSLRAPEAVPTARPAPPPPAAPSGATQRGRGAVGAREVADSATLPGLALGAEVLVAVRLLRSRIEAAASVWPARRATLERSGVGGEFSMLSAEARGCVVPWSARFELAACAGLGIERVSATSFGPIANGRGSGAWAAAAGEGRVTWVVVPWFALHLSIGGTIPFARPTFIIEESGAVHRPAGASLRQALGLELRFF